jgi:hypothetical protein
MTLHFNFERVAGFEITWRYHSWTGMYNTYLSTILKPARQRKGRWHGRPNQGLHDVLSASQRIQDWGGLRETGPGSDDVKYVHRFL